MVETRCTYDEDKPKPFCRFQLLGVRSCLTNHHAEVFFPQEPVRRQVIPNLEQVSFLSNEQCLLQNAFSNFWVEFYHIWLSTRMRLQNAFSNFWVDVISHHIHFWFNVLRPYQKPWVFAKQRAYKMIRVTLLQKGGPTTNFNYKQTSPDHFIPYTCSPFLLWKYHRGCSTHIHYDPVLGDFYPHRWIFKAACASLVMTPSSHRPLSILRGINQDQSLPPRGPPVASGQTSGLG